MRETSVSSVSYESMEAAIHGAYSQAFGSIGYAKEAHIRIESVSKVGDAYKVTIHVSFEELDEELELEKERELERVKEEVLRHEEVLRKEGEVDAEHLAEIRAMLGPHAAMDAEMIMHDFTAAEQVPSTTLEHETGFHPEPAGIHYHDVPKPDYQLPWLYPEGGLQHKISAPDRELIPV